MKRSLEGFKTSWMITNAAQGKPKGYDSVNYVKEIIEKHYAASKSKGTLSYAEYGANSESELVSALVFDVIPPTFNITEKNCKKYELEDYLAGLELILEQFKDIEHANKERLVFLRKFMTELGDKRISRLDPSSNYYIRYFAA